MKVGILIPDRSDRGLFLHQAMVMIQRQTVKPDFVELVNDESYLETDITWRYKLGIERLKEYGADVIIFWENDDWYSEDYIEQLLKDWEENGKPDLFGYDETIYYNLKTNEKRILKHSNRSSMFCSMITSKLDVSFPEDSYIFLDLHLWRNYKGKAVKPKKITCIGIKHGVGKCGGKAHSKDFKYDCIDDNLLLENISEEDRYFYGFVKQII